MENNFDNKIKDFAGWSKTAFELFNKGYYADSLTNMRKSGESACKMMILYRYSGKASNDKIAYKNYKELIEVVIRDNLAPRKVINWLETLQIHGNEATHDTHVMQEQSYYGIIALRLLIYWIYLELLNSSVPEILIKGISQIKEKSDDTSNKKFGEERNKLIKEKEELEKKLNDLKGKKEIENEKIISLTSELNNSESKIKELDTAQQRIKTLENELTRFKIETEELKQKNSIQVVVKKKGRLKIALFVLLFVSLIIGGILIFNYTGNQHNTTIPLTSNTDSLKQIADSFCVLVLPFIILQDNPNIKIYFEDALVNRIRQKVQDLKIPLKVIYKPKENKSISSNNDAFNEGKKENAFVVLWGELYEPTNNDSTQVNIKHALIRNGKPMYDQTGIRSFIKLTDSSAIRIMQEIECVVNLTIAENYVANNKHSDALALLYNTVPVGKTQKGFYCNFLAECHLKLKNYNAAIIEMEKYIKIEPENGYPYAALAYIYAETGDIDKADIFYQKSLKLEPNNVNTLMRYSSLLVRKDSKNQFRAKNLLLEALKYDTSNVMIWYYLAELETFMKDYNSAKLHYNKCLNIDPAFDEAKRKFADILAFQLNEPEKAVDYLNQILSYDNNNVKALFLLGNIYTSTKLKDPSKAEYYFKKCNEIKNVTSNFSTDCGLGMVAFDKKDYKKALMYFLRAYSENSTDIILNDFISQTYMRSREYANAEKFFKLTYQLDSMNYLINYNLGYFYYFAEGNYKNIKKATYYFEKELKTYPYDTMALQWLGNIYMDQKDYKKLREIGGKLYSLTPNSSYVNKLYGYFAELDSNNTKALYHYRKSIEIFPNDPDCYSKAALLMLKISPQKYWKEAIVYAGKAVELDPQNAFNIYMYSKTLIYAGDYNKSTEYYYQALEIDPSLKDAEFEQLLKTRGL